MSTIIIDGKRIAEDVREEVRQETIKLGTDKGITPTLAVVLVGEDPASQVYVRNKKRACEAVGFISRSYELSADTTQEKLLSILDELNADPLVDGILVQLPLPGQIDEHAVICHIDPAKDVDGFHPMNVGALCTGEKGFVSCTPAGVIELLRRSDTVMEGARAVIVGRSNIVGKPMAHLLLRENATVTIAHSRTRELAELCREADIIVAAVGRAHMIGADYVREGATVIDVGINRDPSTGKLMGDVDFDAVVKRCRAITPVPGGVGPMTIAMLMRNCLEAARARRG